MTDDELREMVRASIARLAGGAIIADAPRVFSQHASFARLALVRGDGDDSCLIEPTVRCNHCGYCLSYGH